MSAPRFRFEGKLRQYSAYGDKIVKEYLVSIVATTMNEAVEKARAMAGAEYDNFRKFWSHHLHVISITELEQQPESVPTPPDSRPTNPEGVPGE